MTLASLARLRTATSRSISAENPTGAKGQGGRAREGTGSAAARDLGVGWKVSPSIHIEPGETARLCRIEGVGRITNIWMTTDHRLWRSLILRARWDHAEEPAVEVPVGDFFGQGWGEFAQLSSIPVAANVHGGLNSYWPMPFRSAAEITIENTSTERAVLYFQINYEIDSEPHEDGYFHAQFRRSNPLEAGANHLMLDTVEGHGHYAGTYIAWGSNSSGWWGEGEFKVYLDGDEEFPTICGTGVEDYFGGAWCFDVPGTGYQTYTTPYLGFHQVVRGDDLWKSQRRFGMYRWHIEDPVIFHERLRIEIQALGWRADGRYLPLHDDISSTVFFYLDQPSTTRPASPTADSMELL